LFPAWSGLADYVTELIARFHYIAPFTVLFLCGLGLPIPEEVALIGAGIVLHQGKVEFVPITIVCSAAILLGDAVPYWIGRAWGLAALRKRTFSKILHPERFAKLERKFASHGNWVIFSCRFMPGLRIPAYFMAGTLKMAFARFVLLDFLGVLISVPASIWIGRIFGDSMDDLKKHTKDLHLILAFAVFAMAAVIVWTSWKRARDRRAAQAAEGLAPGAGPAESSAGPEDVPGEPPGT
jgi:membrane protein DedA with SNARE-associated domain